MRKRFLLNKGDKDSKSSGKEKECDKKKRREKK